MSPFRSPATSCPLSGRANSRSVVCIFSAVCTSGIVHAAGMYPSPYGHQAITVLVSVVLVHQNAMSPAPRGSAGLRCALPLPASASTLYSFEGKDVESCTRTPTVFTPSQLPSRVPRVCGVAMACRPEALITSGRAPPGRLSPVGSSCEQAARTRAAATKIRVCFILYILFLFLLFRFIVSLCHRRLRYRPMHHNYI